MSLLLLYNSPSGPVAAVYPDPADVRLGVEYGPSGDDYVGELVPGGPVCGAVSGAPGVSGALGGCGCAGGASMPPIPIGGDYVLSLTGLAGGGAPLNAATVTYVIRAPDGSDAGSGALVHVSGSDGDYSATVDRAATERLVAGWRYTVCVTITQDGYDDYREVPVRAATRGRV